MTKIKTGIHKAKQFFRKNSKKMYMNGLATLTAVSFMTVSAGAEGELTTAITSATSLFGNIVDLIEGNAYLMIFLALGLLRVAFGLFKSAKKSVR